MATREDVLKKINPTSTYIGSAVRSFVNEVTCEDRNKPDKLKKGDVIIVNDGVKKRPAVIIKVHKEYVVSISLTSSKNINSLCESSSRFSKEGYFCNSYNITPIELALENFIYVYDNMKLLNQAIKELKLFISKLC